MSKNVKLSAVEQIAALRAKLAAQEAETKALMEQLENETVNLNKEREEKFAAFIATQNAAMEKFAKSQEMTVEECKNCIRVFSKTGTLFPAKGTASGERKPTVRLTEAQWAEVETQLKDQTTPHSINKCKTIAEKYNVGLQTIYIRAKELGLTAKRVDVAPAAPVTAEPATVAA